VKLWDAERFYAAGGLGGFQRDVTTVAFSPDGQSLLTASRDGTVRVWDAATPASGVSLGMSSASVAVFSADGARALTADANGNAKIWDTATAAEAGKFSGFSGTPQDGVLAPDGSITLLLSEGSTASVWSSKAGASTATLKGHEKDIVRAKFSYDGTRVVTWAADNTARVWDAGTGAQIAVRTLDKGVNDLAFSPDGKRVATIGDEPVARIWDASTGEELLVISELWEPDTFMGGAGRIAFLPDGRLLIAETGKVWIHDGTTGARLSVVREGGDQVNAIAVAADGGFAVLGAKEALVVDLAGNTIVASIKRAESAERAALTADGRSLLTIPWGSSPPNLSHLRPQTPELVAHLQSAVPRCLTGKQRARAYLPPEPPRWCIEQGKWPYRGAAWKDWQAARDAGQAPPMPAE
jgi:WD40 repeat protein